MNRFRQKFIFQFSFLLQCLSDVEFEADGDICIMNPKNCENGLSASLFYKLEFDVDPNDLETNFTKCFDREYILSTGFGCVFSNILNYYFT